MLDIRLIREDAQGVKDALLKKEIDASATIDEILQLDTKRRALVQAAEEQKAEQNKVSKQIPAMKKAGEDTTEIMTQMKTLSDSIKGLDGQLKELEGALGTLMLGLPNMPDADLPGGGKEHNEEIRTFGTPKTFDFAPQNHVDLCTNLGLIDYERGAKIAGSGFWIYRGLGARLEWALLNYFVDTHLGDGYELILVPHLLNHAAGQTAGQFPKFAKDVFWLHSDEGEQKRFLLPTSETALVSMHQGEILTEAELPKKYISYTPCYRREAGSYRSDERGMVRGHQFNKVEMVQYTRPEDSEKAFDELVGKAEALVRDLGFHFRTVRLAAGDCSASMARTYDIEIHIPSMEGYKEVSSVSNARDYQARRGMVRFRREETGKPELVHTLNGSGLATSRILPAIVEQNQRADGSVVVPEVLRKYLGGLEVLTKPE